MPLRLDHLAVRGLTEDEKIKHERRALDSREAQLKVRVTAGVSCTAFCHFSIHHLLTGLCTHCHQVAEKALQLARRDACAIAASLDARERSISSSEEAWPLLLTTVDALEQRLQLLHDFSSNSLSLLH